jgi:hypothetical protein
MQKVNKRKTASEIVKLKKVKLEEAQSKATLFA